MSVIDIHDDIERIGNYDTSLCGCRRRCVSLRVVKRITERIDRITYAAFERQDTQRETENDQY